MTKTERVIKIVVTIQFLMVRSDLHCFPEPGSAAFCPETEKSFVKHGDLEHGNRIYITDGAGKYMFNEGKKYSGTKPRIERDQSGALDQYDISKKQQEEGPQREAFADGRNMSRRHRKRRMAKKAGIFAMGMAAGMVFLLIAAQLLPMQIGASQSLYGKGGSSTSSSNSAINEGSIGKLRLLEQCIRSYYYQPDDVKQETLEDGMYKGIMDSLGDPYTVYYTEEEYNDLTQDTSGVYYGVGAYIGLDTATNAPMFTGIMPGTPAESAGLKVGDIISEVDGTDTLSKSTEEVAKMVKGPKGTSVSIKVLRSGESLTFSVKRDQITVPTVTSEMLSDGIGYLKISEFSDVTTAQFDENYAKLKKEGMKSMIIDLRSNPGGTVTSVTQVASELLPEGLIFYMEDKDGKREEYKCPGADFDLPLVVLVNEYSASASEILAGAIQDAGIGKLVGTKTYGKGVVQNLYPLGDGSGIKVTIAGYFTRNGRNIHKTGIEPDYVVELDEEKYEKDETDTQLEKAKELLLQK